MGTSSGYQMPKGGPWTPLKGDATQFATGGDASGVTPRKLVRNYILASGGVSGLLCGPRQSSGGGYTTSVGRARARSGVGAAMRAASGIGGFLSSVNSVGLQAALRDYGLGDLVGKTAAEIGEGLLDALVGPASSIDDAAARNALAALNEELLDQAVTSVDVERVLTLVVDERGLESIIMRFFGLYIFERFCRDFYERWVKSAGAEAAGRAIRSIRSYIDSLLEIKLTGRDLLRVAWHGEEGQQIVRQVLTDTCAVYVVAS